MDRSDAITVLKSQAEFAEDKFDYQNDREDQRPRANYYYLDLGHAINMPHTNLLDSTNQILAKLFTSLKSLYA